MQESEKDLLAKELPKLEKKEDIEKFAEDAVLLGHEDIAQLAREKIAALETKVEEVAPSVESRKENVESLGGSTEVLQEKVADKDAEIAQVKTETAQKIKEVEKTPTEKTEETKIESKDGSNKDLVKNIGEDLLKKFENLDNKIKPWEKISQLDFSELFNITKSAFEKKDLSTLEEIKKINDSFASRYSVNIPEDIKAMLPWYFNNQYKGQPGREWIDKLGR